MKRLLFVLLILPLMLIAGCVGQMTLGWGTPPTYKDNPPRVIITYPILPESELQMFYGYIPEFSFVKDNVVYSEGVYIPTHYSNGLANLAPYSLGYDNTNDNTRLGFGTKIGYYIPGALPDGYRTTGNPEITQVGIIGQNVQPTSYPVIGKVDPAHPPTMTVQAVMISVPDFSFKKFLWIKYKIETKIEVIVGYVPITQVP